MNRDVTRLVVFVSAVTVLAPLVVPVLAQTPVQRIAFRIDGMAEVTRHENIVYRSLIGSPDTASYGPALEYDVYVPPGAATRTPGVILIHGGVVPGGRDVRPKDWDTYQEWGRLAAAAGFVAITFTHRLTTDDNLDVAGEDVEALLRHVRERGNTYSLDPNNVCIAVYSAGGPLASLFLREPRSWVRCLVLFYPFLDTGHLRVRTPFRAAHSPDRIASLASYSPARWLAPNADRLPPIFLARAGRDAIPGINASIDRFMNAALAAEISLDFHLHRTGEHGFDRPTEDDPRSTEIVEGAIRFMQRHLARPDPDADANPRR